MNSRIRGLACAAALAMSIGASGAVPPVAENPSLDGTAWVVMELQGRMPVGKSAATLLFAQGRVSGSDGCNRYTGGYTLRGSALEVSKLASTQMACPEEVMQRAQAFTDALTSARSVRVKGPRLELLSADGETLAILAAQSLALAGTSWHATGINNGKEAVVSVVRDSRVTLSFGPEGDASGSAGCNNYSVPYKSEGSGLAFGRAATVIPFHSGRRVRA
jgi:heat shock protein HslJ